MEDILSELCINQKAKPKDNRKHTQKKGKQLAKQKSSQTHGNRNE